VADKFYSDDLSKEEVEEIAVFKRHKYGKCKKSCFADGGHRVGMIPMYRPDDGGLAGVSCQLICIECRKKFNDRAFLPDKTQKELQWQK